MSPAEGEFALAEQQVNTLCCLASTSKNYDNETGRIH